MPDVAKNTGILITALSPKAFRFGAESGIAYEVRLPDGKWSKYAPTGERQYAATYDTMSCTTFSALNSVEEQCNWLLDTGKLPADVIALCKELGYLDENNRFNFSDWFTAVMSGTTTQGNDFASVWDSIRNHGLLPQKDGYAPNAFSTIAEWLDRTRVTTAQKTKALKFLDIFEAQYEFILTGVTNPDTIAYHLKHAPIHIASPTCSGWNGNDIVHKCGLEAITHATLAHNSENTIATGIFDHYDPFNKRLAWDYPVPWAVKGVLKLKAPKPAPAKPVYIFTQSLSNGSTGKEVEMWQRALKYYGFYKLDYFTQYFGAWTEQAVRAFQAAYAADILYPIGLTLPTGKIAGQTIKKMNSLLKQ